MGGSYGGASGGSGTATWGTITGTITAQTDLIAAIETPTNDTVYAKGKGPVVISANDDKHRLEANNSNAVVAEVVA